MSLPARLGKYSVVSVLGEGAMGVVYKGFDRGIQRPVALKTIRHDLNLGDDSGASALERFRNEAKAAGKLAHPNIVSVYDFGDAGDLSYIAMEFVEGSSLARYLAKGRTFADEEVASVMVQLLDALEHAHGQGVWHRDIKPANLMITHGGAVKLADFGVARIFNNELTMAGSVIGTPGYMAPEQFIGEPVDARVDIWAAGVLLYLLLCGQPPFSGNAEVLMYKVVNTQPPPPSQVSAGKRPAAFDGVIASALAKKRADRFPHAAAFRDAVISALGRRVPPRVSASSLFPPDDAPTEVTPSSPSRPSNALPPAHWDPAVLHQMEVGRARHLGPVAAALVRRTARSCHDLPTLYARLAEQVTNPAAKAALSNEATVVRSGARATPSAGSRGTPPTIVAAPEVPMSDALVTKATRLLAEHLGPIAAVLARRASGGGATRETFFSALEAAVQDPAARRKLRADLDRLV